MERMTEMNGLTHSICGMSFVQLGVLQDVFNWIYDNILSPVFDFLQGLIRDLLTAIFKLLEPFLELRINMTITIVKKMLESFIYDALFRTCRLVLWIVESVEKLFRTFAGLNPVYIRNDAGVYEKSGSLLFTMLRSSLIQRGMAGMILASFALCFLIAIFATVKAAGDLSGRQTVSKVMRQTARALLRLILIPIMALGLVLTGDAVLSAVDVATNPSQTSVANILFTMSTLDALRTDTYGDAAYYNVSTRSAALRKKGAPDASDFGMTDKYRRDWYMGTKSRDNVTAVLATFDIRKIDYFICIGMGVVFIFLFGMMAVNMVARIFDCLLLLLVEPFFAAMIPLDEGERFDKWQELFIGRLVSGYGAIVAANVYLAVVGILFSGRYNFFSSMTTPAVEYLVKLLFTFVGAYTITKAGPVVTGIMSAQAGTRDAEVTAMSGQLTARAAGFIMAPVRRAAGAAWEQGKAALQQGLQNLTNGGFGGGVSLGGGALAPAGAGAFGQVLGTGPVGVQFSGYRTADGRTVAGGRAGELVAAGAVGAQFGGRRSADGRTIAGGRAGGRPADRFDFDLDGAAAPVAGSFGLDGAAAPVVGDFGLEGMAAPAAGGLGSDAWALFGIEGGTLPGDSESAAFMQAFMGGSAGEPHRHGVPGGGLDGRNRRQFDFLRAGDAPGVFGSNEYTWIGQRDEEERRERKKYEEMLTAQMDAAAVDAAEASVGMDLNGDGVVQGGVDIFGEATTGTADVFGEKPLGALSGERSLLDADSAHAIGAGRGIFEPASAEPLTMEDIVGGSDAVSNEALFGNADPFATSDPLASRDPYAASEPVTAQEQFAGKASETRRTADVFGEKPLSMEDIVGGSDTVSNETLFGNAAPYAAQEPFIASEPFAEKAPEAKRPEDVFGENPLGAASAERSMLGDDAAHAIGAGRGIFEPASAEPLSMEDIVGGSNAISDEALFGSAESFAAQESFVESEPSVTQKPYSERASEAKRPGNVTGETPFEAGDVFGETPLSMEDIVGGSAAVSDETLFGGEEPLGSAEPFGTAQESFAASEPFAEKAPEAKRAEDVFGEIPLSMEDIVGGSNAVSDEALFGNAEPLTMEDIVGGSAAVSNEALFERTDPLAAQEPSAVSASKAQKAKQKKSTGKRQLSMQDILGEGEEKPLNDDDLFAGSINDPDGED